MLNGVHDFSAFTTHKGREDMMKKKKNPIKEVKVGKKQTKEHPGNEIK